MTHTANGLANVSQSAQAAKAFARYITAGPVWVGKQVTGAIQVSWGVVYDILAHGFSGLKRLTMEHIPRVVTLIAKQAFNLSKNTLGVIAKILFDCITAVGTRLQHVALGLFNVLQGIGMLTANAVVGVATFAFYTSYALIDALLVTPALALIEPITMLPWVGGGLAKALLFIKTPLIFAVMAAGAYMGVRYLINQLQTLNAAQAEAVKPATPASGLGDGETLNHSAMPLAPTVAPVLPSAAAAEADIDTSAEAVTPSASPTCR